MLKTQALKAFLETTGNRHLTSLYNSEMEVQVNVAKDNGEVISDVYKGKRWRGWTADGEIWKSFRIPWGADSFPNYTDSELSFNLAKHVEGVGMTGWNWSQTKSMWVGFDFDSIANHKAGMSQQELDNLLNAVANIPWITVVKSTSGKGYHLYIHFETPIVTATHTEHAAVARSLLSVLTLETGFNFQANVDVCGGVLWVYHRKQEGTDGLSLVKQGHPMPSHKVPANWREHINVTAKRAKKVKTPGRLSELTAAQKSILLDSEHSRLLKWFSSAAERDFWWDSDHNMFVCHTLDLAKAHRELTLKGMFFTASSGSSTQNCFCFPATAGSWTVRRHGQNVKEHPYWTVDASGWTRCVFNAPAELESAAKTNKGIRNSKGEFVFLSHRDGVTSVNQMGLEFKLPDTIMLGPDRTFKIKTKGDLLIINVDKAPNEAPPEGFLQYKDTWEKVIDLPKTKKELAAPDELIRHAVSQGTDGGWYIKTQDEWIFESRSNVLSVMVGKETYNKSDIEILVGKCVLAPWKMVNYPFADEYPGDREWNKDAASFKTVPEEGTCDTWLRVINHCGKNLTDSVLADQWCIDNGIKSGGEYLLCWLAALVQKPTQPLPYLFMVGDQNTGKSTLHEALGAFIFKRGYARADRALTNPSGFNSEIANSVLCVVEETDLRVNKEAANRIKDWVTGKTISIRAMYRNVYDIANVTHWIQCANDSNYCLVMPGDTRIVVIQVDKPETEIPKAILFNSLETEAAAFLQLLFSVELSDSPTRLAIPVLTTHHKRELESANKNELEQFIDNSCYVRKGRRTLFDDFFMSFLASIPAENRGSWSKNKVSRMFPRTGILCKGKCGMENLTYIGNLTMVPEERDLHFTYKTNDSNGRMEETV